MSINNIEQLKKDAFDYHEFPKPGKLEIKASKPTNTQRDLCLAYTPGVAEPVKAIALDPKNAYKYTSKGNLVAVISNGTAVLGLGNVGALASKPVMEGKAVLFKRFANIDVFDIEVNSSSSEQFINIVEGIAPTFGGINLEDIKAPECFAIEEALIKKLDIPVFHDDQHGTSIIVAAALLNALELQNKKITEIKLVCLGAGAAGISTMKLLVTLGLPKSNIYMVDREGVIHNDRQNLNIYKKMFSVQTNKRTLAEAIVDADVFIGLSGANLLSEDMLKTMASKPIVFALSNPDPEIHPQIAHNARKDLILATGRSDYPNQVNNALCFPYIFRGALDVQAKIITDEMKIAAVHAIRNLAKEEVPMEICKLYGVQEKFVFGTNYILPKILDPRLYKYVSFAVAQAAINSKVARVHAVKQYEHCES